MNRTPDARLFETMRPRLLGLAYRMLGSMADAEDAVQDTYVKWQVAEKDKIANSEAFLTTVCTNRCLDCLKAAQRARVDYVGPWIPEPLQVETGTTPEADLERAQSLTTAFLFLLERLTPKERAAFLLRKIFGKPYADVAATLGLSEASCRQLVSRADKFVRARSPRSMPSAEEQTAFLNAFLAAVESGSTDRLSGLLARSVQLRTDGGGRATAITRVLEGSETVGKFIVKVLGRLWEPARTEPIEINGVRGLAVFDGSRIETVLTLGFTSKGTIDQVYLIRNPDKLQRLHRPTRHDPSSGALWQ